MGKELWKAGNMLYPLPAVMVSCAEEGKYNIITVAWAGTVCTNPPMLSISVRPERFSYGMIARTKEFVVNLTTKELVRACDYCGVKSGRDVDKFKETGLLAEAAIYVDRGRRRSGAGRALYEALEKALIRQNILNINACIACPEAEDEYLTYDSIRFHERMGYRMAGRFHSAAISSDTGTILSGWRSIWGNILQSRRR